VSSKYVLQVGEGVFFEEGDIDAIYQDFTNFMEFGALFISPPGCSLLKLDASCAESQMERLLKLLSLTDEERDFVRAALSREVNRDFFLVLADYLEEKSKQESSDRIRSLADLEQTQFGGSGV
jgi:hypothetical protein